jgi:Ni,Fe-hydrogenase III small subunit
VDQARCIRCARCLGQGYAFSAPPHWVASRLAELREPEAHASADPRDFPLAPLGRSLHVFLADVGSCQACNLEVLALQNPYYDAARLGITFVPSPHHADVLVVVGIPTGPMVEPVRRAYEALPGPKAVVAVGACALGGGIFRGNEGTGAPLAGKLHVDRFVPGCPPSPLDVLAALLSLGGGPPRGRT